MDALKDTLKKVIDLECSYDEDVEDFFIYQKEDQIGIINCVKSIEEIDNHCEQCKNELLCFRFRSTILDPPYILLSTVGPTKFEKIRSGHRSFEGLDLTNAKIFDMCLNEIEVKEPKDALYVVKSIHISNNLDHCLYLSSLEDMAFTPLKEKAKIFSGKNSANLAIDYVKKYPTFSMSVLEQITQ